MSIPSFLGHTLPSRSTVQRSRDLIFQGHCHLEHRDLTAVPGRGSATVDEREPHYLQSSTGDGYAISTSEVLQFPTGSTTPAPLLACYSSLVGHPSGEPYGAQVASSSSYAAKENRASYIDSDSPLVDPARVYWARQDHPSDYMTNRENTFPLSYTSPLLSYATEQSAGPQESAVPASEDLDKNFAGPTLDPGPVHSPRSRTSGQAIDSDAIWSRLSNPLPLSLQEPHPPDDFMVNNNLPPEQTQIEMAVPPQLLSGFIPPLTNEIYPSAPFPYSYPAPFRSNPTSYSTPDGYISSYHSFLTPNQNPSSSPPQEHLGHPLPVHPQYTRPVDLPGSHGFDAGNKTELHAPGTLDDHSVYVFNDHPSRTLDNSKVHLFRNHATHIPGGDAAGSGVDDYGSLDESRLSSGQVAGPRPQPSPPLNQPPLSSWKLHSRDRVSRAEGRRLSGPSRPTRRSATAKSRVMMTLPKARSISDRNVPNPCGWQVDEGRRCGMLISYGDCADHFAAVHDIEHITWNVKVTCRWCPPKRKKEVSRKNLLRHLREVHLRCARSDSRTIQTLCRH
ncbi:hypothetical protein EDD16DRAFT_1673546 [Pisolithus croceorrhizus]|nr:hypothetical protein EDD16DRAFT_1673546 [Pisolithus croceorrhizus]